MLRGQASVTPQEARGLRTFNDPHKGNCAACHPGDIREGAIPSFSDFGFIALGVPRNRKLPVNAAPAFHDLGLCGPDCTDLKDHPEYCGLPAQYHGNVNMEPLFGGERGAVANDGCGDRRRDRLPQDADRRPSRRCQHRWPRVDADSIRYTMKSHTPLSSM